MRPDALAGVLEAGVGELLERVLGGCPRLVVKVPGPPVPKARPRAFVEGGKVGVRTPKETKRYEAHVRRVAGFVGHARGWPPGGWPSPSVRYVLAVDVVAETDAADLDNVIKSLVDALQGPVLPNDRRVAGIYSHKRVAGRGELPGAVVKVWAIGPT